MVFYSTKDNLLLGVTEASGGSHIGALLGFAVCGVSVGILCLPNLLGGVYGGCCLGSQVGKGKNSYSQLLVQILKEVRSYKVSDWLYSKTYKKLKKKNYLKFVLKKWVKLKLIRIKSFCLEI